MGSQEAQGSEGTWVLQDHLGFQGTMGHQESPDNQDPEVRWVQMGSGALKALRGLGGTKEKLDHEESSQLLKCLEILETVDYQGPVVPLAVKEIKAAQAHGVKLEAMADLETVGLKDLLATLVEMDKKVLLAAVDTVVTREK